MYSRAWMDAVISSRGLVPVTLLLVSFRTFMSYPPRPFVFSHEDPKLLQLARFGYGAARFCALVYVSSTVR